MPHALALGLAMTLLAANPSLPVDDPIEAVPPLPPIVGGHESGSDATPGDATDVDRLYQQLMRQTAPDTEGGDDHVDRLYRQMPPDTGNLKPP